MRHAGNPSVTGVSCDCDPSDAIYSYNIPANADAMIYLHETGHIEITKQDGAQIWAKVLPEGRTLIDSLRAAQERKEAASWRNRPADLEQR